MTVPSTGQQTYFSVVDPQSTLEQLCVLQSRICVPLQEITTSADWSAECSGGARQQLCKHIIMGGYSVQTESWLRPGISPERPGNEITTLINIHSFARCMNSFNSACDIDLQTGAKKRTSKNVQVHTPTILLTASIGRYAWYSWLLQTVLK